MSDHSSTEGHSATHGVQFTFDGQIVRAQPGQTFAGALHNADIHVLSRSFKYHRPRGLFCVTGRCPNCMCTVNGEPNVRVCTRTPVAGDVVKPQNAWPSVRFDIMSIFDKMHRMLPVGFYYKTMHKPRFMWPIFESVIRRIAGLGEVDRSNGGSAHYDKLNLFTDVAVVGGGLRVSTPRTPPPKPVPMSFSSTISGISADTCNTTPVRSMHTFLPSASRSPAIREFRRCRRAPPLGCTKKITLRFSKGTA